MLQTILKCYQICIKLIPRQHLPIFANILINTVALLGEHVYYASARILIHAVIIMIDSEIDGTSNDQTRRFKMTLFAQAVITRDVIV